MGFISRVKEGINKIRDERLEWMKKSETRKAQIDEIRLAQLKRQAQISVQKAKIAKHSGGQSGVGLKAFAGRIADNTGKMFEPPSQQSKPQKKEYDPFRF